MKELIISLSFLFFLVSCDSLTKLKGEPASGASVIVTPTGTQYTISPVAAKTVSLDKIEIYFNGSLPMEAGNMSNITISGGDCSVIGIIPEDTNILSIYLSNQRPGVSYTVNIPGTTFIRPEIVMTGEDTNQQVFEITNIYTIDGDSFSFSGYGSDDNVPPELKIIYPDTVLTMNAFADLQFPVFYHAMDNLELAKVEYKIDNGEYQLAAGQMFNLDIKGIAVGTHTLILKATDLIGNTTSKSVNFTVGFFPTSLSFVEPLPIKNFLPGAAFTVKVSTAMSNTWGMNFKFITHISNHGWAGMAKQSATDWGSTASLIENECGTNKLVVMMIVTNQFGAKSTNYFTNKTLFYDNIIYVSGTGSDTGDGTRWKPWRTTEKAIQFISSMGIGNLKISAGSYGSIPSVPNNTKIIGGYSSDFSTCDPLFYKSLLLSMNIVNVSNIIVGNLYFQDIKNYISTCKKIIISNCNITAAGFGLNIQSCSDLALKDNTIHDCMNSGVIANNCPNSIISNNQIYNNNSAYGYGGGLYLSSDTYIRIICNRIFNNISAAGGGIFISSSVGCEISGNIISNNTTTDHSWGGGGLLLWYCYYSLIKGNLFYQNNTGGDYGGGGVFCTGSRFTSIESNTFIKNSASHYAGGIYLYTSDDISFFGNLVIQNTSSLNGGGLYLHHSGYNCVLAPINQAIFKHNFS